MNLNVDPRQPSATTLGGTKPSHPWVTGLARDDGSPLVEAGTRPYSYLGDCDCPDDCPRDHENE